MFKRPPREFSYEYKLSVVERMAAGETIGALARELGLSRQLLHKWRERVRAGGPTALRRRGRPRKLVLVPPAPPAQPEAGLVAAQALIAELERKIGRQQLELDFFKQALRQVEELRRPHDGHGATASTPSSKR